MRHPPTTRSCVSAQASRWRSSPIRRTISRSRPPTISGSPRRWPVSCGERRSLPDGRGSDGRPSSGGGASPSGRADRLSDGNGVWPGFAGAGPGRPGGGTPEGPATSTSANLPGSPPAPGAEAIAQDFAPAVEAGTLLVLDGGVLGNSPPSTIVDCTQRTPRLIREGALKLGELRRAAGRLAP